uniref:Uncharacterized protein n=1 Tax=Anguilla anguilla TaxID=7936 RepID=A0A0E9VFA5_ANGAN
MRLFLVVQRCAS